MKTHYPNLRIVYISSRIYAGYATSNLNPEPYAYESAFAVKWVVQAQIDQMRSSRIDPRAGDLNFNSGVAPWIAWGPYLWTDGMNPRSDGLTWARADVESDGTHPSQSGEQKVGEMLLGFLKKEPTARSWFLATTTPARRRAIAHCGDARSPIDVGCAFRLSRRNSPIRSFLRDKDFDSQSREIALCVTPLGRHYGLRCLPRGSKSCAMPSWGCCSALPSASQTSSSIQLRITRPLL